MKKGGEEECLVFRVWCLVTKHQSRNTEHAFRSEATDHFMTLRSTNSRCASSSTFQGYPADKQEIDVWLVIRANSSPQ
jgi:hypothetical protein